jgi:hypothetical protein
MNFLKKQLRNWLNNHENNSMNIIQKSKSTAISVEGESLSTEPMRLSIFRANGGTVVETRVYDRQKDRNQTQLHIISHDADLGQSLAKIITMESLRG